MHSVLQFTRTSLSLRPNGTRKRHHLEQRHGRAGDHEGGWVGCPGEEVRNGHVGGHEQLGLEAELLQGQAQQLRLLERGQAQEALAAEQVEADPRTGATRPALALQGAGPAHPDRLEQRGARQAVKGLLQTRRVPR